MTTICPVCDKAWPIEKPLAEGTVHICAEHLPAPGHPRDLAARQNRVAALAEITKQLGKSMAVVRS